MRLSASYLGHPLPPERFLVLISIRGSVNHRAIVQMEGLDQLKIKWTQQERNLATFRLLAQCLKPSMLPHGLVGCKIKLEENIQILKVLWINYLEQNSWCKIHLNILQLLWDPKALCGYKVYIRSHCEASQPSWHPQSYSSKINFSIMCQSTLNH
jgi:hypothetical protein